MDTNSQQFQKAYTDLVSAFIQFMNVVNPGSANNNAAVLHLIASQLNQVLEIVNAQPGVSQENNNVEQIRNDVQQNPYGQQYPNQQNPYQAQQNPYGQQYPNQQNQFGQQNPYGQQYPNQQNPFQPQQNQYGQQNPYGQQYPNQQNPFQTQQNQFGQQNPYGQQYPNQQNQFGQQYPTQQNPYQNPQNQHGQQNPYQPQQNQYETPQLSSQGQNNGPNINLGPDAVIRYSQGPESFKNNLVFKGASLKEGKDDTPLRETGAAYLYKLTLDYTNKVGKIEIVPQQDTSDFGALKIITLNPDSYLPTLICERPDPLPEKIKKISSNSVLPLVLEGKSWAIADGGKFVIDIEIE